MNSIRKSVSAYLLVILICCGCADDTIPPASMESPVSSADAGTLTPSSDSSVVESTLTPSSNSSTAECALPQDSDSFDVVTAANAQDYVNQMGLGWNLGNSLDCTDCTWLNSDLEYETGWGNPPVTRELISYIKSQGFTTIRIPVTWNDHLNENNIINEAWMNRVQEVVDWCMEEDFFVILNIHHESDWLSNASADYNNVMLKYCTIWSQIANRFGSYNEKLIFESMNEIGFENLNTEDGCILISQINSEFTKLIRSSGQNNDKRYLLLAGYYTDIDSTCHEAFALPEDDRIILSVHYYTPSDFAIADSSSGWGYRNNWGTPEDLAYLNTQFQKLKINFIDRGIPVIVGEYGVIEKDKDPASRILWFQSVCQTALNYHCCPIIWDNGEIIDRNNLIWKTPELKNVLFESTK